MVVPDENAMDYTIYHDIYSILNVTSKNTKKDVALQ